MKHTFSFKDNFTNILSNVIKHGYFINITSNLGNQTFLELSISCMKKWRYVNDGAGVYNYLHVTLYHEQFRLFFKESAQFNMRIRTEYIIPLITIV